MVLSLVVATTLLMAACAGGGDSPSATAVPATIAATASNAPAKAPSEDVREIRLIADNLRFSPATITIKKGERVRFAVTSNDIFHTFTFIDDGREINLDLQQGETKSTKVLKFDAPQEIVFWCEPHRTLDMEGKLVITNI